MKYFLPALRLKIFMLVLLGLAYPFLVTELSQTLFPVQASGDFIKRGDQNVGASLIGQNFTQNQYFWPRPSAVDFNPMNSGGSNLGPISADLKKAVEERRAKLQAAHGVEAGEPPQDLLFASASGVDPHISPEAALYQMKRVAQARHMDVAQVLQLVNKATTSRKWGILGEPIVHVLTLNLSLDQAQ